MSRIELSPNSAGSGNFTITSPNSNTNQILTLPDSTGELAIVTELTQLQAEDDTSTVFGQVSGQRLAQAVAANVISGTIYDYQEFLTSGTWTKPSNAVAGDRVVVQAIGGGQGGGYTIGAGSSVTTAFGGSGGRGLIYTFDDIDDLSSTETVVVGVGGAGRSSNGVTGLSGGNTTFGTASTEGYLFANGGGASGLPSVYKNGVLRPLYSSLDVGGSSNESSWLGGAGGGSTSYRNDPGVGPNGEFGAASANGSTGGDGRDGATLPTSGTFPGGGGGASAISISGAGADGVVRVWCIRLQGV